MRALKLFFLTIIVFASALSGQTSRVDSIYKNLSSDAKLAQLFIVMDSISVDSVAIKTLPTPAYFIFSGTKNGNLKKLGVANSNRSLSICNIANNKMEGVNSQQMPNDYLLEAGQFETTNTNLLPYLAQKAKSAGSSSFSFDFTSVWATTLDFKLINISNKRFISTENPAIKGVILNTQGGFLYVDVFQFPQNLFDQINQVPITPEKTTIVDEPFDLTDKTSKFALTNILNGEGLLYTTDFSKDFNLLKEAIANNLVPKAIIEKAVRKSIAHQIATSNGMSFQSVVNIPLEEISIARKGVTHIANENLFLPIVNIDSLNITILALGDAKFEQLESSLKFYSPKCKILALTSLDSTLIDSIKTATKNSNLIILATSSESKVDINRRYDLNTISHIIGNKNTLLATFSPYKDLQLIKEIIPLKAIIQGYQNSNYTQQIIGENIFGGGEFFGKSPFPVKGICDRGQGINNKAIRLGKALPEEVEMNHETLSKIDDVIAMGIEQRAMPGCQVLVARKGKIIFHKAYGSYEYLPIVPTTDTTIYDIASVTKIMASVPQVMRLVDQGTLNIDSTLQTYLPNLQTTNKGDLKLSELLTHHAGLIAFIPFYQNTIDKNLTEGPLFSNKYNDKYSVKVDERLYFNRYSVSRTDLISTTQSEVYSIKVGRDLFLNKSYIDTMYAQLDSSRIRNRGKYLYSDCGYYYFKKIIEKQNNQSLDSSLYANFTAPLGMFRTSYNPLNKFPLEQIAPTEQDLMFRKQTVRGYVHDPGAAMLGGVGGHAGLFSTSSDMAIMMQMYLNGGVYGGKRYISEATLKKFTTYAYPTSRRGIGFDKREPDAKKINPVSDYCSQQSFGHSGFTGTLVWADPKYDLVYIFLSNRVHPNAYNKKLIKLDIRSKVQDVIYQSIIE